MKHRLLVTGLAISSLSLAVASPAQGGPANRVFASARSGNDLNACASVTTPCQTLAGAFAQVATDGEIIMLDTGGYGAVTITHGVTIEAAPGITGFIHPSSGVAIMVNAASAMVTLRGLVLNVGSSNAIQVEAVGTLNVESCFITGFTNNGILMHAAGTLNVRDTNIKNCVFGIFLAPSVGAVKASLDRCRLDGNVTGFVADSGAGASTTTTATNSTASNNTNYGWNAGSGSGGLDVLNLELCVASGNAADGVYSDASNASAAIRISFCVLNNNGGFGANRHGTGVIETRSNNTAGGNASGPSAGAFFTIPVI